MITAGLTGGIASGKSLVGRFLVQCGAVLIDADTVARDAVEPGTEGWRRVVETFGNEILNEDTSIDRIRLGKLVFSDEALRHRLNSLLHPLVLQEIKTKTAELSRRYSCGIGVVEVPLLVECNLQEAFDAIIVVTTTEEIQKQRMAERNGLTPLEAQKRINAQISSEVRNSCADYIIENTGTMEQLRRRTENVFRCLVQRDEEKCRSRKE